MAFGRAPSFGTDSQDSRVELFRAGRVAVGVDKHWVCRREYSVDSA